MDKEYENYVCSYCFDNPDRCACESAPYRLICIDRNIQEHIRLLNKKGYTTNYCCESHNKDQNLYISFYKRYGIGEAISLPDGFKLHKGGNSIEHLYDKKLTDEEFKLDKQEHLDILLDWCKSLPYNQD